MRSVKNQCKAGRAGVSDIPVLAPGEKSQIGEFNPALTTPVNSGIYETKTRDQNQGQLFPLAPWKLGLNIFAWAI